jgi:hypothetical protein
MTPTHPFHWDVNPILIQIGPLTVRWFGVSFAAAFLVGYGIMRGIYRREAADLAAWTAPPRGSRITPCPRFGGAPFGTKCRQLLRRAFATYSWRTRPELTSTAA